MPFTGRTWMLADPPLTGYRLPIRYLDFQADRIERVLAACRCPERVVGGLVMPATVYYGIVLRDPTSPPFIRQYLGERLALTLGVPEVQLISRGNLAILFAPAVPISEIERLK
jgi:hypothetical protein